MQRKVVEQSIMISEMCLERTFNSEDQDIYDKDVPERVQLRNQGYPSLTHCY